MRKPHLVAPSVHLKEDGGMALYDNLGRVTEALNAAHDALRRAAPDGHDYYAPETRNGHSGFKLACAQHQRRMQVIEALITELNDEQNLILDQSGFTP